MKQAREFVALRCIWKGRTDGVLVCFDGKCFTAVVIVKWEDFLLADAML